MPPGKSSARRAHAAGRRGLEWAIRADQREVFAALASGRHRESLREFFGAQAHADLTALVARARSIKRAAAPRVLIVPGMMRSRLGEMGSGHSSPRLIWLDPGEIAAGRLRELRLPPVKPIGAMGVVLVTYARLKLALDAAGFAAEFYPYDWRLGVDEVGAAFAARIAAERRPVSIVAHSMGGLVARIALGQLAKRRVRKLIQLGTPNRGCFLPLQALRGTHPFVQKISRLDPLLSAQRLAAEVFCTFPGLYQLLPPRRGRDGPDLLDPESWPADGPKPDVRLLARAAEVRRLMAAPDSRMAHIVGVNRETVVAVRRCAAGFEYASSANGDGTVPAALAAVRGISSYFADESHVQLANNPTVIGAVVDLLENGITRRLPQRFTPCRARLTRTDDAGLRSLDAGKIDWGRLDPHGRAALFAELDGGRPCK